MGLEKEKGHLRPGPTFTTAVSCQMRTNRPSLGQCWMRIAESHFNAV